MDYFGLIYLSLFSLAWLFSLEDHIKHKEKIYMLLLMFTSGAFLITSVVLTWPESIHDYLKTSWKYVLIYLIVAEVIIMNYELKVLPKRLKEKGNIDIEVDTAAKGFSIFIELLLILPGIYYAYLVAFK